MAPDSNTHVINFRRLLYSVLAIVIFTMVDRFPQYHGMGSLLGHFSGSRLLKMIPVMLVGILAGILIVASYRSKWDTIPAFLEKSRQPSRGFRIFSWLTFIVLSLTCPAGVFGSLWSPESIIPNYFILGLLILAGSTCYYLSTKNASLPLAMVFTAVLYTTIARVAFYLPEISTQMTSLGWSEASRYYYASLFFSNSVYGTSAPFPVLHPSRYLLQSIPFIIPSLPIWVHRAWQVFLWIALPIIGSASITRRVKLKSTLLAMTITLWGYLFLIQGPVYYHLMVCVIIVSAGFSTQKPVRSLVFVLLASIWAGISRINWLPVPGLLAVFFYILEVPRSGKQFWRYWSWPAIWAASGLIVAFLTTKAYVVISGNSAENFGTSFTSSLLWYRLFPNITYPHGILLSILIISLPSILLILLKLIRNRGVIHAERITVLSAILTLFFAGGLVVSVKIGGGSNLHNLDAFIVFLLVSVIYLYSDRVRPESITTHTWRAASWVVTALLIAVPFVIVSQTISQLTRFDNTPVKEDLVTLQGIIDTTPKMDGEVLFISQRHYITFRYVTGVDLVPDYEKVFLMEMAMSGNQTYLDQFEQDLKTHRFSLIIAESLSMIIQDEEDVFNEENNAWTTRVTSLIRKYYYESVELPNALIVVLKPISSSGK